jgi:hypothetical protein
MAQTRDSVHARIPYQLDTDRYCTYEDDGDDADDACVRMGDVVDVCENELGYDLDVHSVVRSGTIAGVEYDMLGFVSGVTLIEPGDDGTERFVDFDGYFCRHKEASNGTD